MITLQTDSRYRIDDTSGIITPALLVFREIVEENLSTMIEIAGDVSRLRPHCKTHKMREVIELQVARGITRHKCATFAEAEMIAEVGVTDICLAYSLVGANVGRAVRFVRTYPQVRFSVTADHPAHVVALGKAMAEAKQSVEVFLDLDTGQHRTGIPAGQEAKALYGLIVETAGLIPAGLHIYDGHQEHPTRDERRVAIDAEWAKIMALRDDLVAEGWPVPWIVAGGSKSFPIYAEKDEPNLELSPGTCLFHDAGYGSRFRDLPFTPAALLLTRVISRPTADRITLDLGYKAVASDPPLASRAVFPGLADAKSVLQNEEHLVLETASAEEYQPGDELLAIPWHACPTSALHKQAFVVDDGRVVAEWQVASRDRWLTI